MEMEVRSDGDVTTLILKGRMIGGQDDERLREEVEDLVEEGRVNIVLDLAAVTYVDSACLGEIIRCHKTVSQNAGKFKLTNPRESLRTLLSRMRLWSLFDE